MEISKFLSNFDKMGGPATNNRFVVEFTKPKAMTAEKNLETISMLCHQAPLPGVAIGTVNSSQPYGYGPNYKMPWGALFSDITLDMYLDNNGVVLNFWQKWINSIIPINVDSVTKIKDNQVPFFVAYMDDYATDIKITHLDITNSKIVTYTLINAYPTLLNDNNLSYSSIDNISTLNVRLTFTRHVIEFFKISKQEVEVLTQTADSTNLKAESRTDLQYTQTSQYSPPTVELFNSYKNIIPSLSTLLV